MLRCGSIFVVYKYARKACWWLGSYVRHTVTDTSIAVFQILRTARRFVELKLVNGSRVEPCSRCYHPAHQQYSFSYALWM